jgi:hypothetical protein
MCQLWGIRVAGAVANPSTHSTGRHQRAETNRRSRAEYTLLTDH